MFSMLGDRCLICQVFILKFFFFLQIFDEFFSNKKKLGFVPPGMPYPNVSNMPAPGYNQGLDVARRPNPRGAPRRPIPSRGGQLEVAGIVVGNWGPNLALNRPRMAPPQVNFKFRSSLVR